MKRGWVVISCGWQGDLPRVPGLIGMRTPEARDAEGRPLRGRVYTQVQSTGPVADFLLSDRGHVPYPAADLEEPDALLTVRDQPDGPATTIARERWRFARSEGGRVVPDAGHIHLEGGFEKGRLYQVTYTAEGAPVQGLAMAALRDAVAWLKHGGAAEGNPAPGRLRWAYAYGRSQTGRLPAHAGLRGPQPRRAGARGPRRRHRQRAPAACGASSTSASASTRRTATT